MQYSGRIMQTYRLRVLGLLAVLVVALAAPEAHAQRQDPLEGLDRDQRRVFQNYTRLFCTQFFRFGESRFVILPNHSARRENSSGRTYDETEERMTVVNSYVRNGIRHNKKILPPAGEVIASAMVIPDIEVGHYGHINSVTIDKVLGPEEMIVRNIVLIPGDQVGTEKNELRKKLAERQKQYQGKRYRLLGFKTEGVSAGASYVGPKNRGLHIAVMSTDPENGVEFVLVNYDKLKRTRTSEFAEVLRYVKLEPGEFINMVRDNRETHKTKGDRASLITLYKRFYSRYVPRKITTGPATRPEPKPEPKPAPRPEPKPEPEPQPKPEPKPQPKPEPEPQPQPEPEPEEEEDDWEYEEGDETNNDEPNFFGIPF